MKNSFLFSLFLFFSFLFLFSLSLFSFSFLFFLFSFLYLYLYLYLSYLWWSSRLSTKLFISCQRLMTCFVVLPSFSLTSNSCVAVQSQTA